MAGKKNILCVIGQLGNGGTERQLYLFLKHLDTAQYNASVVVAGSSGGIWEERIRNDLGIGIRFMGDCAAWKKLLLFRKEIKLAEPDVIFSWSFFTNAFSLTAGKIPFIGSLRQQYSEEERNLGNMRRKASLFPRKIIVNSNTIADELISKGVAEKKLKVVFNIFEPAFSNASNFSEKRKEIRSDFCSRYNIPEERVIIAGIGRNSPTKDFPFFVDVIRTVKERYGKNIHAVLIGSGGTAMEKRIKELNLESNFTLTGDIPDAKLLLPAADIFFLSSLQEGMPNVLIEAADAGCTPFATDVGGVRDIFRNVPKDILDKILLRNRDPETAAEMLSTLIEDRNLQKTAAKYAQTFLAELAPEKIMKQYCDILFAEK